MVTVREAIRKLEAKYPDKRIVSGLDMGDFYAFSMMRRNVNPTSIVSIPVQPTMNAIRKNNGEEFLFHIAHSSEGELKGEINVTLYLSAEDAAFSKRMKALLEG